MKNTRAASREIEQRVRETLERMSEERAAQGGSDAGFRTRDISDACDLTIYAVRRVLLLLVESGEATRTPNCPGRSVRWWWAGVAEDKHPGTDT